MWYLVFECPVYTFLLLFSIHLPFPKNLGVFFCFKSLQGTLNRIDWTRFLPNRGLPYPYIIHFPQVTFLFYCHELFKFFMIIIFIILI